MKIVQRIKNLFLVEGEQSDSYHTFNELYNHRIVLFIALCRAYSEDVTEYKHVPIWRSKLHYDGTMFDDWFVMGIGKERGKQITYHLPIKKWEDTDFAETLNNAPEWDGHTSEDVISRIGKI